MSAQSVDLDGIAADLAGSVETAAKGNDVGVMLALYGLQLSLAMAQDTRRQADATEALVKELYRLRRKAS